MLQLDTSSDAPLRILHVLRAPVGGLFRHVLDLAHEQIARGHHVGLIADSLTGGATAAQRLGALEPHLALGLMRLPIHRLPHPSDLSAIIAVNGRIAEVKPDVVHGHGSKGGAYARVSGLTSGKQSPIRVYTPHGGSLNYHAGSFAHRVFMVMERLLAARTDALLFESVFIAGRFETFVGKPSGVARTIPNGISPSELEPIAQKPDAADLLYVGEFRSAKGLDTFIEGLALLAQRGTKPKTLFVGDGPERALLEASARRAGVADQISFGAPRPAREAFSHGRLMVVPSRFEFAALYRPRSGRRANPADRHKCRRYVGDLRSLRGSPDRRRRSGRAGGRHREGARRNPGRESAESPDSRELCGLALFDLRHGGPDTPGLSRRHRRAGEGMKDERP